MVEQVNFQANGRINRYDLQNRYVFGGRLVMKTALHIGGGKFTLSNSDSPVILTPENIPFIPGSSFKGALRSTIEKFVPALPGNVFTCGLMELSEGEEKAARRDEKVCSTARQKAIAKDRRDHPGREAQIYREARENLCNTCRVFGSPFAASLISINDLYMSESSKQWKDIIQRRDGVAIDRDSERAKDGLKYDFEVVPATTAFDLEITLENAMPEDLQILCVGLSEFVHGFGIIGGMRSRGLGSCKLEDLKISGLELAGQDALTGKDINKQEQKPRLREYLVQRKFTYVLSGEQSEQFLETQIGRLFGDEQKTEK